MHKKPHIVDILQFCTNLEGKILSQDSKSLTNLFICDMKDFYRWITNTSYKQI